MPEPTAPASPPPSPNPTTLRYVGGLLASGIPLAAALELLSRDAATAHLVPDHASLAALLATGASLGSALEGRPDLVDPVARTLIAAAEKGGWKDADTARLARLLEHRGRALQQTAELEATIDLLYDALQRVHTARLTHSLGALLACGTEPAVALELCVHGEDDVDGKELGEAVVKLRAGTPLADVLAELATLPGIAAAVAAAGASGGAAARVLEGASRLFDRQADALLASLVARLTATQRSDLALSSIVVPSIEDGSGGDEEEGDDESDDDEGGDESDDDEGAGEDDEGEDDEGADEDEDSEDDEGADENEDSEEDDEDEDDQPEAAASAPSATEGGAASQTDTAPTAPTPVEAQAAPAPPAAPAIPASWAERKRGTVKAWSAGARTDDPTVRVAHAPLVTEGIGAGKSFLFLFGYKRHSPRDQEMLKAELAHIDDDIEVLRKAGYTVVVDPQATRSELLEALAGKAEGAVGLVPAGIYWSAHGGPDGSVETCDGSTVGPADIDPATVAEGLRLMILSACYVGSRSRTWRKAIGGKALVVGWGRPVTLERAVDFLEPDDATSTDLDDLIRRFLLSDAPIPGEIEEGGAGSEAAPLSGSSEGLSERVKAVLSMLGGVGREEHPTHLVVELPLENGRSQRARLSIIESAQAFAEAEPLFGVEADVGEVTAVVDLRALLVGSRPGYPRLALVKSDADEPRLVVQGFLPLARARSQDLAALVYQVSERADQLEKRIFGIDEA
jgi:hypothetical protein